MEEGIVKLLVVGIIFGIAGASYDPDNNVKEIRVGLRYQLVGGALYR